MSEGHICDNCLTVAPIGEAVGWWRLESIDGLIALGEKDEYHFCSKACLLTRISRELGSRQLADA